MPPTVESRTSDVCYVNAQGELMCGGSIERYDIKWDATLKPAIEGAIEGISPERLSLILALADQVMKSPLTDACINTRTTDTVDSVQQVLNTPPPVMLLYRYVSLPGNIMAAYFMQNHNVMGAYDCQKRWSNTKPAC